jgi:hypothetical protein
MKGQKRKRFQKEAPLWALALAWSMMALSCASPAPKAEAPPPPHFEATPSQEETPPTAHESTPASREIPPAPRESASVLPSAPPPVSGKIAPPAPSPSSAPVDQSKDSFYVHTVRWKGETASIIAAWYTGDGGNWKALAEANPQVNMNRIHGGIKILIPEALLNTRNPLPQYFVNRFYSKAKKENSQTNLQQDKGQEEEPKLFGPKKYHSK